jgi:putative alpha-1,2-mannosidase
MHNDLRRNYGEEFLERGIAHPITHTLDLAFGYHCTAEVARHVGDEDLAAQLDAMAAKWTGAFDPAPGCWSTRRSTRAGGGTTRSDSPTTWPPASTWPAAKRRSANCSTGSSVSASRRSSSWARRPDAESVAAGYALDRFEGLNNEPDMEAPWAYHYIGRPDRTAEVVHDIVENQFATGRGGLPGNDDSGGLSSWYVWASLGLFPVAGQHLVFVNAPSFASARIRVRGGTFVIDTAGFVEPEPDRPPQYVQAASLDGVPLDRSWITTSELHRGGRLLIELGPDPSPWGRTRRPPSTSTRQGGR